MLFLIFSTRHLLNRGCCSWICEQMSQWVQDMGAREGQMREWLLWDEDKKKINTSFFKIALESLWGSRLYSFNTFPYSTSPIIIITFLGRLKEVAIPPYDFWHLARHFSSILHRLYLNWNAELEVIFQVLITMVFLFVRDARPFAQVQRYQSVHLLKLVCISLIHSPNNTRADKTLVTGLGQKKKAHLKVFMIFFMIIMYMELGFPIQICRIYCIHFTALTV